MRKVLLASGIFVACGIACHPAWAAGGIAQPGGQTAGTPEEITITAQKRSEKLKSVPVSVSVITGRALTAGNASSIEDLNKAVPSVSLSGSTNGRVPYAIRGISSVANETTVGLESGVGIQVDGIPIPSDSQAATVLTDIAQVEVLNGPQASLGGRGAAAGLINFVTRPPQNIWTGSLTADATDDNEQRVSGFITGPLTDGLDFSLSGYRDHIQYPITNIANGEKTDLINYGGRLKLLYRPTADLTVRLTGHLADSNSAGDNFVYTYLTPGATMLFPGSPLTQALELQGIRPGWQNQNVHSIANNIGSRIRDEDLSLTIDYQLGGDTLTSTTGYQQERQRNDQDLFVVDNYFWNVLTHGMAPPFYNYQVQYEDIKQISEELKLVSPATDRFSYVVGTFISSTGISEQEYRALPPAAVGIDVRPTTTTYDLYGRLTTRLTPSWKLITGARFNVDALTYTYNQAVYAPQGAQHSSGSDTSGTFVGDITLQKTFSPDAMAYASYTRGYSPKVYNTSLPLSSNLPISPVGREDINSFGLGTKDSFLDHRVLLELSAFDTIYDNYQIQTQESLPGFINPPVILTSAGQAETRGVEINTTFRPAPDTTMVFNAAYIDAKFNKYNAAACYGFDAAQQTLAQGCHVSPTTSIATQNIAGKPLPNSPKFKFDIDLSQRVPLGVSPYDVILGGNYTYRTSAQMLVDQNPFGVQGAYGLLDLYATLERDDGRYAFTAFINNVADTHYFVDVEDFWASVWASNAVVGQPGRDAHRYFGGRLTAKF